jgi:hypothetical protein
MRKVERIVDWLPIDAEPRYRFGNLIDNDPVFVWFADLSGKIVYHIANGAIRDITIPLLDIDPVKQCGLEEAIMKKLISETSIAQLWIVNAGNHRKGFFGVR